MKLKVYPNPFTALGPDGMPCGRVLVEPGHPRPYDIVGGKLRRERIERPEDELSKKVKNLDTRDPLVRGVAVVRMRPVDAAATPYFKERVACGDLIAADLETWRALGYAKKSFRAPLDVLAAAARARIDEWTAITGDPPALASLALFEVDGEIKLVPSGGVDAPLGKVVGLAVLAITPPKKPPRQHPVADASAPVS